MLKPIQNICVELGMHFSFRRKEEEQAVGAHYCEKMEDLLQQSDFVMLVVNLTPENHKMIGKKELGLMKPTATLINIGRGRISTRMGYGSIVKVVFYLIMLAFCTRASVCDIPVLFESQNSWQSTN